MQVADRNKELRTTALLAIVCLILQLALAPNISLAQGHINFALIFAALMALKIGGKTGTICGFCAGLLYDLSSTSPVGLMALLLTVMSYILGREVRDRLAGHFGPSMGQMAIAISIVSVLQQVFASILGQSSSFLGSFGFIAIPTIALTLLASLPFVYRYSRQQVSHASLGGERAFRGAKRAAKHLR